MHHRALWAALLAAWMSPGCQGVPQEGRARGPGISGYREPDSAAQSWYVKGGGYFGSTEVDNDLGPALHGLSAGARMESGKILTAGAPILELGARVGVGRASAEKFDTIAQGSNVKYTGTEVYVEPVLRAYLTSSTLRPYVEGFAGFAHSNLKLDTIVPSQPTVHAQEGAEGFSYGGGIGIEFIVADGISGPLTMTFGAEYRQTEFDTRSGDLELENVLGIFLLGTRW